jgi:hypothetical protein
MTAATGLRCTICRQPIQGHPAHAKPGERKRVWCGNGATYRTAGAAWCAACWRAQVREVNGSYLRMLRETLAHLEAAAVDGSRIRATAEYVAAHLDDEDAREQAERAARVAA